MRHHITTFRKGKLVRLATALLILSLTLLAAAPRVRAQQSGTVKLSMQAGYDGYYRNNDWVPLLINASNDGPDITGNLEVTYFNTAGLAASAYKTSIELPTRSSKQVFLYIVLQNYASVVQVDLTTTEGKVVASDSRQLKLARAGDLVYAIVTDSPRGAVDLKSVRTGLGDSFQVNWQITNIPPRAAGLHGLDALVLTDVDTGTLTAEQRQAIHDWILTGGHLIVTGGPSWQKTQAGLLDLLPMRATGTTTLTSLPSIGVFSGTPGDKLAAPDGSPILVAQGALAPDATVLISESNMPLLARRNLGQGVVDYLSVDPELEPYLSWGGRGSFWFSLFASSGQQHPVWANGITVPSQAVYAANFIKGARLPDVFQLCGFLGVYIILIGPLNYLVLKRFGRRELAWFTIPLIILSCSVVAYGTGFSLRGTTATINRLALVQVWPGSDQGEVQGILALLAPRRSNYDLAVKDGLSLNFLSNGSSPNTTSNTKIAIHEEINQEARNVPVDAGTTATFTVNGYVPVQKMDGQAVVTLTNRGGTTIQVKFKNTTGLTLSNAVVMAMGVARDLGTVNPGEEKTIDLQVSANESPQLMIGVSNSQINNYGYGNNYNPNGGTIKDIMGPNYYSYSGYGRYGNYTYNTDQQEYGRRQTFLTSIITDSDSTGGRGTGVYIAGWTTTSPVDVELKGAGFTTEDTTLYVYSLPVSVKAAASTVELPSPYITWTVGKDSPRRDLSPYNVNLQLGDEVIFRYNPFPLVRLKEVTGITLTVKNGNSTSLAQGIVSMWDWQAKQWVDLQVTGYVTRVSNPARFVGPENTIEVQIAVAPGQNGLNYGQFDITLYGTMEAK